MVRYPDIRHIRTALLVVLMMITGIPLGLADKDPPNVALRPVPQTPAWWTKHFQQINQEVKDGGEAELVFIGDSLTALWRFNGRHAWSHYYRHRKALNLGAAGDQIQHTLWRLQHGNLEGLSPRLAVLMIGVNNIYQPVAHVTSGIGKTIKLLRRKLPRTRILVLGILPYGERPGRQRRKIAQVNTIVSRLADGQWIHVLNIGDLFVNPDGTISQELMPDYLHLTPMGYELWAGAMEPKILELLGEDIGRLRYWMPWDLHRGYRDAGAEAVKLDMEEILTRALSHCRFTAVGYHGTCPAPAPSLALTY